MPETEHKIFGHLYERDKEKAEGHISDGRVKILTDNGLHPVSEYTLQLLHMHYGRAESIGDLLRESHRVMDVHSIPRHLDGQDMSGLVQRTTWLVNRKEELEGQLESAQGDLGFIGDYLTGIGIPEDEDPVRRVSHLCFLVLSVRELLGKLSPTVGSLGDVLVQKVQEASDSIVAMQSVASTAYQLQGALNDIRLQLTPSEEECTSEQSEAEILEP